ncbi:MAG TPA: hypothetical protein VGG39_05770 [Polyangiaceae bacterium]
MVAPNARPLADPEREALAARWRSEGLPPEEWAAHYGHTVLASSFADYRYAARGLDDWIQRVHAVLRSPVLLQRCRDMFLTQAERDRIDGEEGGGGP